MKLITIGQLVCLYNGRSQDPVKFALKLQAEGKIKIFYVYGMMKIQILTP